MDFELEIDPNGDLMIVGDDDALWSLRQQVNRCGEDSAFASLVDELDMSLTEFTVTCEDGVFELPSHSIVKRLLRDGIVFLDRISS